MGPIYIEKKVTFSSLIFETKNLSNIHFNSCNFINISFKDTVLKDISFNECIFNEVRIYESSRNRFINVVLNDCDLTAVILIDEQDNNYAEYSPIGIKTILTEVGFQIKEENEVVLLEKEVLVKNEKFKKYVKKFLTKFNTSTYQYEKDIREDVSFSGISDIIIDEVIPLLIKHNIIELKETQKSKQANTRAWRLIYRDIPAIFQADDNPSSSLNKFWQDVNSHG